MLKLFYTSLLQPRQPGLARHTYVHSYHRNLVTQASKAHLFT